MVEGASLRFAGQWENQPKYGQQFRAQSVEAAAVSSAEDMVVYLSGGILPGVGPAIAARIVDAFGDRTLQVRPTVRIVRGTRADGPSTARKLRGPNDDTRTAFNIDVDLFVDSETVS